MVDEKKRGDKVNKCNGGWVSEFGHWILRRIHVEQGYRV